MEKIKFSLFGVKCNSATQMYITYAAKGLTTPKTDSARWFFRFLMLRILDILDKISMNSIVFRAPKDGNFQENRRFFSTLRACIFMTTGRILKSLPIKRIYASRYVDLAWFHCAKIKMWNILARFFAGTYRIFENQRLAPPYV